MRRGLIAVIVLGLAACSSGSKSSTPTTRPTQTATQVASIVAQYRTILNEWLPNQDTACESLTLDKPTCTDALGTVQDVAAQLARALTAASPPEELRQLVKETISAATSLGANDAEFTTCLAAAQSAAAVSECANENGSVTAAMTLKLDAWDAYL